MKTGFPNKLEPKNTKSKKSPWDFTCPDYDERSSCYVNAGSHHGVGHKQPIGHADKVKQFVPCLPQGHVNTMKDDDVRLNNLLIETEK